MTNTPKVRIGFGSGAKAYVETGVDLALSRWMTHACVSCLRMQVVLMECMRGLHSGLQTGTLRHTSQWVTLLGTVGRASTKEVNRLDANYPITAKRL